MATYAAQTTVPWQSSRDEIERTLTRYDATTFMYGWTERGAVISFDAHGRRIRFTLPLPDRKSREFTHTAAKGLVRNPAEAEKAYDQAVRQRWRALALVLKAKLEAIEAGISGFEEEFLAHIMLPNGSTVAEATLPNIAVMYEVGNMRPLLEIGA